MVKTRVYFLRIHVIAARCCRLAGFEDPRLFLLPKSFLRRLKILLRMTIEVYLFF